jgi:Raf kinase inhibitor-like YbhB/YbcL family protein
MIIKSTIETPIKALNIYCPLSINNSMMPIKFTCDGLNVSPPINIDGLPSAAFVLAIIMEDLNSPTPFWVHWLACNIPLTKHLKENAVIGISGLNDFSKSYYFGPCPTYGKHEYNFRVYALDSLVNIPLGSKKHDFEKSIVGHVLAFGDWNIFYERKI